MMFLSGQFASGDIREEVVNRLVDPFRDKNYYYLIFFPYFILFIFLYSYIGVNLNLNIRNVGNIVLLMLILEIYSIY